ncbi:unnamed protein product [Schistosoma turkestanicum]|nr:unnamed protein product [Schistosoma turkestanicum]
MVFYLEKIHKNSKIIIEALNNLREKKNTIINRFQKNTKMFLRFLLTIFCCGLILCQMVNSQYHRESDYLREEPYRYRGFYEEEPSDIQKRVQFLRLGKRLARKSAYPYMN